MLTKEKVVELLQSSTPIMNYEKMKSDMAGGDLHISQEDVLRVMIKALSAYGDIIQEILKELD